MRQRVERIGDEFVTWQRTNLFIALGANGSPRLW
jgi:hypothetical protein